MKHFAKYLLACMLVPVVVLGMEPDRKKVCREEPLPDWLEEQLVQAKQSKALDLEPPLYSARWLMSVGQGDALAQRIKTLSLLHTIAFGYLFRLSVPKNAVKPIHRAIAALPYLRHLEIKTGTYFGSFDDDNDDATWQSGLSVIRYARALESLQLNYLPTSVLRLSQLGSALAGSQITNLYLTFSFNTFNKKELEAFFGPVACMRALRSLSLRASGLNHFDAIRWHVLGSVIRRIKLLDLGANDFGFVPDQHFYFELYDMYDELWLEHMGDDAWQALANELVISEVEELCMAHNYLDKVSDRVWALFVHTLEWMKYLKKLDVRGNNFWRVSLKRHELLAEALMRNRNRLTLIINVSDDPVIESSEGPIGFWANMRDRGLLNVRIV